MVPAAKTTETHVVVSISWGGAYHLNAWAPQKRPHFLQNNPSRNKMSLTLTPKPLGGSGVGGKARRDCPVVDLPHIGPIMFRV